MSLSTTAYRTGLCTLLAFICFALANESDSTSTREDTLHTKKAILMLPKMVVTPGSFSVMGGRPLSKQVLTEKDLKNMSWSEDISRAVTRLPGVTSSDFSSKFVVRGGENDEVLFNVDGMELYEPFHQRDFLGGIFSIVDIETIREVELLTGGYSAEYGNRLSGVFNMKTKTAPDSQRMGLVGLSMMNAHLYTDGTFADNRGSYMVSGRRGLLDQCFKAIGEDERIPIFYDAMVKTAFKLKPEHTLSFHTIYAGDSTAIRDISEDAYDIHDTRYDNIHSWLTLNSWYNSLLSSRSILYGGYIRQKRFGSMLKNEYTDSVDFSLSDKRAYQFFGIKQDWTLEFSERFLAKLGFNAKQVHSDYDYRFSIRDIRIAPADTLVSYSNDINAQMNPSGQQVEGYFSTRFGIVPKRLFFEPGIRADYISYTHEKLFSPRVAAAFAFSENSVIRAAWGFYYQPQFINDLEINFGNTGFKASELAKHYVLGLEHLLNVFNHKINVRMEGYYKDISNLSPYNENLRDPWEVFPESRNDVLKIYRNSATAKGLECFLKHDQGGMFSWWFSYALAWSDEDIDSLEFEGSLVKNTGIVPRTTDQRHTIYADINFRPNDKWHFNLSWQFHSGWPTTTYTYDFDTISTGRLFWFAEHNKFRGDRFEPYHQMGLRAARYFFLKRSTINVFVHVINLYNRENIRKFDLDVTNEQEQLVPDGQGGYQYFRDDATWLGIIPIVGVTWQF